jgi:hypothetical protein
MKLRHGLWTAAASAAALLSRGRGLVLAGAVYSGSWDGMTNGNADENICRGAAGLFRGWAGFSQ